MRSTILLCSLFTVLLLVSPSFGQSRDEEEILDEIEGSGDLSDTEKNMPILAKIPKETDDEDLFDGSGGGIDEPEKTTTSTIKPTTIKVTSPQTTTPISTTVRPTSQRPTTRRPAIITEMPEPTAEEKEEVKIVEPTENKPQGPSEIGEDTEPSQGFGLGAIIGLAVAALLILIILIIICVALRKKRQADGREKGKGSPVTEPMLGQKPVDV